MANYYLNIKSPVKADGNEAFRLLSFSGHEEISRLFSFTLELDSLRQDIKPAEIVGQKVTWSVQDSDGSERFFNGYVSRFVAGRSQQPGGTRSYSAEIVPWLWFLTRTADCRIFAETKVPDILEEIFGELGFAVYEKKLHAGSYTSWPYCVQYRETDFNFVSRMMEQEGIYYYFIHSDGEHKLILSDGPAGYTSGSVKEVRYEYDFPPPVKSITSWVHQYQFIPGRYVQTDYEPIQGAAKSSQTPASLLLGNQPLSNADGKKPKTIDINKFEIFDYAAEVESKDESQTYTKMRMEEEEVPYSVASGSSLCDFFSAGMKFELTNHSDQAENSDYVLVSVQHSASDSSLGYGGGQAYTNSFSCIPASAPFRPARITRKPAIHGTQTAVVVGPPGSEINADKYGRVKVQFYWDRKGSRLQSEQPTPIWVRVGQIMAGKNWGALFIPRVGQEVIVSYLEGDPDCPIITGVVYNGDQLPPYDPEVDPTKSCIKTNSSPGGEGFNEIRFEDKKDKEQIFIHAERNMDVCVKGTSLERIYGHRHQIIGWEKDGEKGGDQREMVYQDKHLNIKRNQIEHIEGNMEFLIGKGEAEEGGKLDVVIEKDETKQVGGKQDLEVVGDQSSKVGGTVSLTVGGEQHTKVGTNYALDSGQEIHVKAGMKVILEAGAQLTIKGPGGFVDIGPSGVTIQGNMVNINSGGSAGAGSGVKAKEPQAPKEAAPTTPDMADNAKSGQKSTPF